MEQLVLVELLELLDKVMLVVLVLVIGVTLQHGLVAVVVLEELEVILMVLTAEQQELELHLQ